ncbi:uncharacterized protein N7529_001073 [Penicillium soppii]|uniref:uncharacterized protein n=1 Tax=Penicillium soppii TaxID=69789 RepID=UPI0025470A86|nr:uncharacterized protein N7529_001073 [Penicillium soppii]KAJ5882401.1 hypothetical protein N7529_001073 [Penicillium soppii]
MNCKILDFIVAGSAEQSGANARSARSERVSPITPSHLSLTPCAATTSHFTDLAVLISTSPKCKVVAFAVGAKSNVIALQEVVTDAASTHCGRPNAEENKFRWENNRSRTEAATEPAFLSTMQASKGQMLWWTYL